jgi:PrgI family protein
MHEQYGATIPADVERRDAIFLNLTAHQLAILVPVGALVWLAYMATDTLVPLPVFAAIAAPVLAATAALALLERDGVSLDRLLVDALKQHAAPRRLVPAPEGVPAVPSWATTRGERPLLPAPLRLPAQAIRPDGVIDLGGDGMAVVVACSTVSFALRTPSEQAGLVGAFAGWLNSLTGPTQIVVHAAPINLAPAVVALREHAAALPHPALEEAALDHAAFLAELSATRDLLSRQVLVVIREPHAPAASDRGRDSEGTAARALQRAEHTTRALAAAGITARVLDAGQVTATLVGAADPTAPPTDPAMAAPDELVTAAGFQAGR